MSLSSKEPVLGWAIHIVLRYILDFVIRIERPRALPPCGAPAGEERLRTLKAGSPEARNSWRTNTGASPTDDGASFCAPATRAPHGGGHASAGTCFARSSLPFSALKDVPAAPGKPDVLSVRAENVLKELAAELTGERPPKGRWVPSDDLLRKLGYKDLRAARNCGPQTTDEIVRWARSRGVVIERPFHDGKSLSRMWRDIIAGFSAAEFAKAEIVQALERSMRRKNTRIPVAFQNILVKLLSANVR